MNHKKHQAMAEELANDLKTPEDLSQLSAFLTKLTVEATLKGEINYPLVTLKSPLKVITATTVAVAYLKDSKSIMAKLS
jgi:hypothetical protein